MSMCMRKRVCIEAPIMPRFSLIRSIFIFPLVLFNQSIAGMHMYKPPPSLGL